MPYTPYTLLLCSRGLQKDRACTELQAAFDRLRGNGTKVVYDITAWVYDTVKDFDLSWEEYEAARKVGHARAAMLAEDYGVTCTVFDQSEASFDPKVFAAAVEDADVYYTDGGNTWALQHWWRVRGTHELVGGLVRAGKLLYVGSSAGAIISGKSIEIALWKGWDAQWPWQASYNKKTDWNDPSTMRAMNLMGGMGFFPHYESKWAALYTQSIAKTDHTVLFSANGHGVEVYLQSPTAAPAVTLLSPEGLGYDVPCCMPKKPLTISSVMEKMTRPGPAVSLPLWTTAIALSIFVLLK